MTALEDLDALLVSLPGFSLLTESMKQRALDTALVPDGLGVWPGQPGYQATYDVYWAAIGLITFLQAQPVVRQTASEGTSVTVDAPSWSGLLAYYRSMSKIASASAASPVLTLVEIPDVPHVQRVPMTYGGGDSDVNVDTDLA